MTNNGVEKLDHLHSQIVIIGRAEYGLWLIPYKAYVYERERQGPDRRQPFLENAELFNLFTVSWPRKEGRFTRVFLRRGPLSRQYPENE